MMEMEYSGFGVNTMPADALAPRVARGSVGMVLAVCDKQHVGLIFCEFGPLLVNKIQDIIRNVNASFIIFKTI